MKQLLFQGKLHHVLTIFAIALVGVSLFHFLIAEAVTVRAIGSLSVRVAPNAGAVGSEFVEIEYAGPGVAVFDGWAIHNSAGEVHALDGQQIVGGQKLKICEEGSGATGCGAFWTGNDVFDDAGDTFKLVNAQGGIAIEKSYNTSDVSTILTGTGAFVTAVYGKQDKVLVCHENSKSEFRAHNASVNSLVKGFESGKSGHGTHDTDIIPSFTYDIGDGIGYYAGNNWPDETGMHANDCQ